MRLAYDLEVVAKVLEKEKKITGATLTAKRAIEILRNSDYYPTVSEFLSSIDKIDDERVTYVHSLEVGLLCLHFQHDMEKHLGTTFDSEILLVGGLIHDIGKVSTPLYILNKPIRLSESEFSIMKQHVDDGKEIALSNEITHLDILAMIEFHHETPERTGYKGLDLSELTPYATVINIADQFSAISQWRPYKASRTKEETLEIMMVHNKVDKNIIDIIS